MSRRQKLIQRWRDSPPTEEQFEKIRSVLEYYGFTFRFGSSHPVASHPDLRDNPSFQMGEITIPTMKGRMVKGFYLKRIIVALEYLGVFDI